MADSLESESAEALLSIKNGRVSTSPKSPARRGYSTRIRKRNRLFYNDDEETSYQPPIRSSPRKATRVASPEKTAGPSAINKKSAQTIGIRLRNLLKLPKAHKWVCYEFFYSNLDRPLFEGDNDFCVCLKESLPQLKTRQLARAQWCKIRRLMGKPRRMSHAFLEEERRALHSKRLKIRLLQQRKLADLTHFKDLPDEIPLPLVIGTKVTARLRKPQDGLFTGSIDAVDTSNATYRITFDRQGLGTHSIPDYEVQSNEPQETMPISSFGEKHRPRSNYFTPSKFLPGTPPPHLENDPVLGGAASIKSHLLGLEGSTLGGFPIKFLVLVVRLSKILDVKKEKIRQLREMNTQAEKMKSYQEPITIDFQKRYAGVVLELDKLNKDLNEYLQQVQQYCQEIAPEQGLEPMNQNSKLREKCEEESIDLVENENNALGRKGVQNERVLKLVTRLTALMLQIKCLAENDLNSFELKSLSESLAEIQDNVEKNNLRTFQNNVEVHVNHIQSGMSQMGNLHAFASEGLL
uniref:DIRP domain-containing protein n=1 Tax=Strigamia maritima TaxID=126957 RepID=T1IXW4_STRMM